MECLVKSLLIYKVKSDGNKKRNILLEVIDRELLILTLKIDKPLILKYCSFYI